MTCPHCGCKDRFFTCNRCGEQFCGHLDESGVRIYDQKHEVIGVVLKLGEKREYIYLNCKAQ